MKLQTCSRGKVGTSLIGGSVSFGCLHNSGKVVFMSEFQEHAVPESKMSQCALECTGDQLAIAKETGGRFGMGTNMYPLSSLLGQDKDASIAALPVDELIEKADDFAGVFAEHKYEIVKKLQEKKHICGMTGDGVNAALHSRRQIFE